jgi:hypothetical protein
LALDGEVGVGYAAVERDAVRDAEVVDGVEGDFVEVLRGGDISVGLDVRVFGVQRNRPGRMLSS